MEKILSKILTFCLLLTVLESCKKYPDRPPIFEPYDSVAMPPDRRILVIGIDGLNSNAFQTATTPNYTAMLEHGKFAWDAKSDIISKDASAWKTLISGVTYSTHHISDSSFLQDASSAAPDIENFTSAPNFPSVFNFLIRSKLYNTPTVIISSWGKMASSVMPEISSQYIVSNDQIVKDSTISVLKSEDSKIVMVHFNGPSKVAINVSDPTATFSSSSTPYLNAMKTVDGYIGEILKALKSRPHYNKSEEWLVVITGTHGGIDKTYGGTSEAETVVPTLYYNENFLKQEFTKQGIYSSIKLQGTFASNFTNATVNDNPAFNPGTGSYSIQLKIKGQVTTYYPHFFSKTKDFSTTNPAGGWSFFTASDDGQWKFALKGTSASNKWQATTTRVFDGLWHTMTVVLYDSTVDGVSERWIKRFTDGVRINEGSTSRDITNYGNITNSLPLILGYGGDDYIYGGKDNANPLSVNVADVLLMKRALSDAEVSANLCSSSLAKDPNTVSYWPCNDAIGGIFHNIVASNADFKLNGNFQWATSTSYPCSFSPNPPPGKKTLFFKNVDVSAQMFYWLGLTIPASWSSEGKIWLDQYEKEFYK